MGGSHAMIYFSSIRHWLRISEFPWKRLFSLPSFFSSSYPFFLFLHIRPAIGAHCVYLLCHPRIDWPMWRLKVFFSPPLFTHSLTLLPPFLSQPLIPSTSSTQTHLAVPPLTYWSPRRLYPFAPDPVAMDAASSVYIHHQLILILRHILYGFSRPQRNTWYNPMASAGFVTFSFRFLSYFSLGFHLSIWFHEEKEKK
jgi:hypothetical protein